MFNIDETTVDKEESGVWADFKGSKLLITSSGNTKFQRMFSKLQVPHRRAIDKGSLDPTTQLDIMTKAMSHHLLIDWKDVIDSTGNNVPYSTDRAYAALRGNSELRDFVTEFSTNLQNYVEEVKEDLGKSVPISSGGKPNTEDKEKSS